VLLLASCHRNAEALARVPRPDSQLHHRQLGRARGHRFAAISTPPVHPPACPDLSRLPRRDASSIRAFPRRHGACRTGLRCAHPEQTSQGSRGLLPGRRQAQVLARGRSHGRALSRPRPHALLARGRGPDGGRLSPRESFDRHHPGRFHAAALGCISAPAGRRGESGPAEPRSIRRGTS